MPRNFIPFAIAYDFDGTLAPGNMQEREFIPRIGMGKRAFWNASTARARAHGADNILAYMQLMLEKANERQVPVRRSDFEDYGRHITFFAGVRGWFRRVNSYGTRLGIRVEHYVISSGIREMVTGTPISGAFKAIFASSFVYDQHNVARWPALAVNFTGKTQYLFRINKGCLDVADHTLINRFVPKSERPVPFENMIFIGDGETDIPCFRVVKDQGGHSIGVYRPHAKGQRQKAERLLAQDRVQFIAPADYRNSRRLDQLVKSILRKVATDTSLRTS